VPTATGVTANVAASTNAVAASDKIPYAVSAVSTTDLFSIVTLLTVNAKAAACIVLKLYTADTSLAVLPAMNLILNVLA